MGVAEWSVVGSLLVAVGALFFTRWAYFKTKETNEIRDFINNKVESLEQSISNVKENITRIDTFSGVIADRLRQVENSLVDKDTVRNMIESRVTPVENSVDKLSTLMDQNFRDVKGAQIATEDKLLKILESNSEIKAFLRVYLKEGHGDG